MVIVNVCLSLCEVTHFLQYPLGFFKVRLLDSVKDSL